MVTRVLIAEDSPVQAQHLRMQLERAGYQVALATNGAAALEMFQSNGPFDLIVSDVLMPEMDGYELCRRIRQESGSDPPVILLTTLNHPSDVIKALEAGADNFINKPYESDQLLERVAVVLHHQQLRSQRKLQVGITLSLMGKQVVIESGKEQILDALLSTFDELLRSKQREHETLIQAESLRNSRRFLQSVLNAVGAAVAVIDADGLIQVVNEPWQRFIYMHGLESNSCGEGANLPEYLEQIHGPCSDFSLRLAAAIRNFIKSPSPLFAFEYRFAGSTGESTYDVLGTVLEDDSAQRFVFSFSDVTEREHATAALRRHTEVLQTVLDSAPDAMIMVDQQGYMVQANEQAEALFGYAPEELIGQPVEMLIPEDRSQDHRGHVQAYFRSPSNRPMGAGLQLAGKHRQGREFPADIRLSHVQTHNGQFAIVAVRDISQQLRAQQVQAVQHAVTRVLAESGSWQTAAPSLLEAVCQQRAWSLGVAWLVNVETARLDFFASHGAESDSDTFSPLEQQCRQLEVSLGEGFLGRVWEQRDAAGVANLETQTDAPCREAALACGLHCLIAFPLRSEQHVLGIIAFFADRTNAFSDDDFAVLDTIGRQIGQYLSRKEAEFHLAQAEHQLRQSQKMEAIGQLAGGIAHDFNNQLAVIQGFSELALDKLDPQHPLREDLEQIQLAGEKAAAVTRQLLAFSRKQVLSPTIVDLNALVEHSMKMFARLIGEHIELSFQPHPALGKVRADAGQIDQVILNLIVNARDAMPGGGKLMLQTQNVEVDEAYVRQRPEVEPGDYVMLAVSDTGVGMDTATQNRIFEPFFTTKAEGQGTGLGLATAHGIVRQSGGFVWVYSELGQGTTFKLYFPQVALSGKPTTVAQVPTLESLRGTGRILLVEDEDSVRALVRKILVEFGYEVLEAAHAEQALQVCQELTAPLDLLLIDVVMPHGSGAIVAERLLEQFPNIHVVFMSGYTSDADVVNKVISNGATFLQKPVMPRTLLATMKKLLG